MISLSDISVNGFLNLQNYIFYQNASKALWTWEKIEKKLKLSLLLSNCYSVIFHNIPFTQCQPHTSRHVTKIIKLIFSFIVYRKRHYVRSKLWLYRQQKKNVKIYSKSGSRDFRLPFVIHNAQCVWKTRRWTV